MSEVRNPYVGPRAFEENDRDFFFGRDSETRQIASLVIARRGVLLHAESGAGKTSLLKASLIPYLQQHKRINVLPVSRVGGQLPPGLNVDDVRNVFTLNALLNFGVDADFELIMHLSLAQGLQQLDLLPPAVDRPSPYLLILDQLEEVFTHFPERYADRERFFVEVQDCLETYPHLSLLLSMRDDYLAQIDAFAGLMPNRLRTRFHLERLQFESALEAVQQPAQDQGRPFAEGVAEELVNNLRRSQLRATASDDEAGVDGAAPVPPILDRYVEPVQLQVVCQQLWHNLPPDRKSILQEDVQRFGDVDQALTQFYETVLQEAAKTTDVAEAALRLWFSEEIITPRRTRGLVYRGAQFSGSLPNAAVDILNDAYLIRAEIRGQDKWYELVHDRLVEPILMANRLWRERRRSALTVATQAWLDSGRDSDLLYSGGQLRKLEAEAAGEKLSEDEQAFLQTSYTEEQRRRGRRNRLITIGASILVTFFATLTILALWNAARAAQAERDAISAKAEAQTNLTMVQTAEAVAQEERVMAELNAEEARQAEATAQASQATAVASEAVAVDEQATAQALSVAAEAQAFTIAANARLQADPEQSLLLALEAVSLTEAAGLPPLSETVSTLEVLLQQSRYYRTLRLPETSFKTMSLSPVGRPYLATISHRGELDVWEADNGRVRRFSAAPPAANLVQFSPDGQTLVSTNDRNEWQLWDVATGELLLTVAAHAAAINALAFSPDGESLVTARVVSRQSDAAQEVNTVRVWNADTGDLRFELDYQTWVDTLAFSSDGRYLLTSGQTIRLWDMNRNGIDLGFPDAVPWAPVLSFSPDGRFLATADGEGAIQIWALPSLEPVTALLDSLVSVTELKFSADSDQLYAADGRGRVQIWNTDTWQSLPGLAGPEAWINAMAVDLNQEYLATGTNQRQIQLWFLPTRQLVATLQGHATEITELAFDGDGKFLVSLSEDGTINVWQVVPPAAARTLLGHTAGLQQAIFDPNGQRIATGGNDGQVLLWDTSSRDLLYRFDTLQGWVRALQFSPDGDSLAVADDGSTVRVWQTSTGREQATFSGHRGPVNALVYSSNGRFLATGDAGGTIRLWSATGGRPLATWSVNAAVAALVFDRAGRFLAAVTTTGEAFVWTVEQRTEQMRGFGENAGVTAVAFDQSGRYLATATQAGTIRLWDVGTGGAGQLFSGHSGPVYDLQFGPGERWLFSAGADRTVRVWNLVSGELAATLTGHTDLITNLAFNADASVLASASADATVRVWNLDLLTPRESTLRSILSGHTGRVNRVTLNPTGDLLLTAGTDTTARLWPIQSLPLPTLLYEADRRVSRLLSDVERENLAQTVQNIAQQTQSSSDVPVQSATNEGVLTGARPESESLSPCPVEPEGDFASLWRKYQSRLGCPDPNQIEPLAGLFAEQLFENGQLFWSAEAEIFIAVLGTDRGQWLLFPENVADWEEGDPDLSCNLGPPPPGLVQPIRGFGALWCADESLRQTLGWATDTERGFEDEVDLLQTFETGFIFRDSDGLTNNLAYILFDDGTYVRERY